MAKDSNKAKTRIELTYFDKMQKINVQNILYSSNRKIMMGKQLKVHITCLNKYLLSIIRALIISSPVAMVTSSS